MNHTSSAFETLVALNGDEDIKSMLVENGVTLPHVAPPDKDVCAKQLVDKKTNYIWLVIKFYHPGDEGYLAFGLPVNTPSQCIERAWRFVLESLPTKNGYSFTDLGPLSNN